MLSEKIVQFFELQEQAFDVFGTECIELREKLVKHQSMKEVSGYEAYDVLHKPADIRILEHTIPMTYQVREVFRKRLNLKSLKIWTIKAHYLKNFAAFLNPFNL